MTLERAALLSLFVGLLAIVQPWVHALFVLGFPLILVGVVTYGAAAQRGANGKAGA